MPFTPSHIVAILPLYYARKTLPLSALAIGCMIPDLPLFFQVGISYSSFHSFSGIVLYCLPFGLAVWALYSWVLKTPLYALLPGILQHRIAHPAIMPFRSITLKYMSLVALCILIGALSHIVWDAFTHRGRWGANLFPTLSQFHKIGPITAYGTSYLQYASSILGFGIIAVLFTRRIMMARPFIPAHQQRGLQAIPQLKPISKWSLILFLIGSGILLAYYNFIKTKEWNIDLSERIRFMITDTVSYEFWVILSYCIAFFILRIKYFKANNKSDDQ